ncbi:MAG: amidohydrolase family protein, partial [bacterium]|nr:amidohydrolase family protein [bacterium]
MLTIDTHAHIYSPDEKRYPPRENPNRPPGGKASLKDLRQLCVANGVDGVCAVQTSSFYHFDNRYTVDSAAANRSWVAGVCTLNPDDPTSPDTLRRYAREFNVTAMRSIPAASGRFVDDGVEALWKTALDVDIVINVLTGRERVDDVETLVRKFPKLRVLIDHGFNLRAGPGLEPT